MCVWKPERIKRAEREQEEEDRKKERESLIWSSVDELVPTELKAVESTFSTSAGQ